MISCLKGDMSVMSYLQCPIEMFQTFVESHVIEGTVFEIDHVLPVSKFNLLDKKHVAICFHWCNLRAISPHANKVKSNNIIEKDLKDQRDKCLKFAQNNSLDFIDIYEYYKNHLKHFNQVHRKVG